MWRRTPSAKKTHASASLLISNLALVEELPARGERRRHSGAEEVVGAGQDEVVGARRRCLAGAVSSNPEAGACSVPPPEVAPVTAAQTPRLIFSFLLARCSTPGVDEG